jgi:hypothetical protein
MSSTLRLLKLDRPSGEYQPGEKMVGQILVEGNQGRSIRSAELSVLWYTVGQGEEDFEVHHFERFVDEPNRPLDLRVPKRFSVLLPPSPESYDGQIFKVCWCVRLRLYPQLGPETLEEAPFRLGDVPAAATVKPE